MQRRLPLRIFRVGAPLIMDEIMGAGPAVLYKHRTGCPTRGSFTGGLLRTLPGMFIGHSEIVAFLFLLPGDEERGPESIGNWCPWCPPSENRGRWGSLSWDSVDNKKQSWASSPIVEPKHEFHTRASDGNYGVFFSTASTGASMVTSTSAPGFSLTFSPAAFLSVFSTRISLYK